MRSFLSKLLGGLQIFGGLTGFLLTILQNTSELIKTQHQTGLSNINWFSSIIIPFAFLILYLMSVRAGVALYRDQDKGYALSRLLQIPQIPVIITPAISYLFVITYGIPLGVLIKAPQMIFNYKLVSLSHSWFTIKTMPITIEAYYINIIPIVFLFLLHYCKKQAKQDDLT